MSGTSVQAEPQSPRALLRAMREQDPEGVAFVKEAFRGGRPEDDHLALFLWRCRCLGLDPFSGHFQARIRRDERTGQPELVVETTREGLRAIAEGTGRLLEIGEPEFDRPFDGAPPIWSRVSVRYLAAAGGRELKATVTVFFEEFRRETEFWGRMAWNMTGKVAEAAAIRKAFPVETCGLGTVSGEVEDLAGSFVSVQEAAEQVDRALDELHEAPTTRVERPRARPTEIPS